MKTLTLIVILVLLNFLSNCKDVNQPNIAEIRREEIIISKPSPTPKLVNNKWQPAIFNGLRIGIDSRSDAIRILGKPDTSGFSDLNDLTVDTDREDVYMLDKYKNFDFYGELTVSSSKKSGVITEVESRPDGLTVDRAIKFFGNDYKKTYYDFVECPGDAGSSAIYESANGEMKFIEYRSKGIAISIDEFEKQVKDISFINRPIGMTSTTCSDDAKKPHK